MENWVLRRFSPVDIVIHMQRWSCALMLNSKPLQTETIVGLDGIDRTSNELTLALCLLPAIEINVSILSRPV